METQLQKWEEFIEKHGDVEFVWLQLLSYTSKLLVRIIPRAKFTEMLKKGELLSVATVILHLLPGDRLADGAGTSGKFHFQPDISTAYCQAGSNGTRAVINVDCVDKDGSPIDMCARSKLRSLYASLQSEMQCQMLVGYEIEVIFLRPEQKDGVVTHYEPINFVHSFTGMSSEDRGYLDLIETTARSLAEVGIALEQFHAEAGPGQWEFVLPPKQPLEAVDALLRARETIMHVAESFGLRATVSTQPVPEQACNGAHVHMSVTPLGDEPDTRAEAFFAGIIQHMPAILPFTLPTDMSYGRIATGIWSGGEYAAWGWENKDVALRRVWTNRFEIKLVDGLSNPYLVLCALLSAGIMGMRKNLPLTGGDCQKPAARLSAQEREALGITAALPNTLDKSLACLEKDAQLKEMMGPHMVSSYVSLKRGEAKFLRGMNDSQRRRWVIARY